LTGNGTIQTHLLLVLDHPAKSNPRQAEISNYKQGGLQARREGIRTERKKANRDLEKGWRERNS